jgi:hypothetical protein
MRSIVIAVLLLVSLNTSYAQGVLILNNHTGTIDAPVSLADGTGPGQTMVAGLFLIRNGIPELIETTTFRSLSSSAPAPMYFNQKMVSVPGVPPGAPATFRLRVWSTNFSTFEGAAAGSGCYGEFMTTNGTPDIIVRALGDPNRGGQEPVQDVLLEGILPLDIPCKRASPQSLTLIPALQLGTPEVSATAAALEIRTGFIGRSMLLQYSTNLSTWLSIATNTPSTNRFTVTQPVSAAEPFGAYRALIPAE